MLIQNLLSSHKLCFNHINFVTVFGFSNPKCLITPFSDYQDGTGRTGGDVMIKNVKKIIRAKKNAKIHDRLRANLFRGTEWIKDFQFPNEN